MQRYFIITAIIVTVLVAGTAAYFYIFAGPADISVAPTENVNLPISGARTPNAGDTGTTTAANPVESPKIISARLIKISAGPVVPGEAVVNIKAVNASSSPDVAVSYIEKRSGNVYSYLIRSGTLTRTNNRTIPGIQSAAWLPNASAAFVRYLSGDNFSTINTYYLPANGSGTATTSTYGFFLPQNLSDIAVSSTSVLTTASGVNGSIGSLVRTDGTRTSEVFTTPLSSLRGVFAGKNQYLVYTKPSALISGAAFLVDSAGRFSRIAGPHNGLVASASPSGKWVLVSYVVNATMRMKLVNATTGEALPLPIATIADKCAWTADDSAIYCGIPMNSSAGFNYPDDWYQGAVQFSDRIWKIEVSGRYAQLVLDFSKETQRTIDVLAPTIDPSETAFVFVNKNDGSLWSYSL